MKRITKCGPVTLGSAIGKLLTPTLTLVAAAVAVLPSYRVGAVGVEFNLSGAPTSQTVEIDGEFGGKAIFADQWSQPTGSGVFQPFLTLDSNGQTSTGNSNIEQGYNTDGTVAMYLDQLRPNALGNKTITYGALQRIDINGKSYVAFVLDANEPGSDKSLISIDNIRIYSSADNKTTAGIGQSNLDDLGTKVWAMNDPLTTGTTPPDLNGFNVNQWVKLDANQNNNNGSNANGGSGQGDMIVYIPVDDFTAAGTKDSDYVWFYNLNGVHYSVDGDLSAQAGYEEWKALTGPNNVPDGGNTLVLFGTAIAALGVFARRRTLASVA